MLCAVTRGGPPAAGADRPTSIVLPGATLAAFSVALIARMTRSSMLEVLEADYVRTARSKGVVERAVVYKHALRNGFIPVLTVIGIQFGTLLGGAVLTESVFAWPGIGRLLVDSIFARDFPMVQGIIVVYALLFIVVNLVVDVLYAFVNPRIEY
jgi:ABC-type dipeptide/oligopeptide/nickel transport system permease component